MLLRHISPKYHGNIIKKAIFKVPAPCPSTGLIPPPTRMHSAFPRAGEKASQGSQQLYH